jgi:hypothetical protein
MSQETPFDFVCSQIERATELSTLEARGTVRLALKAAGMDAKSVGVSQMRVVLDKVMPGELRNRGCADPERVCADIATQLGAKTFATPSGDSPETIFARLGGNA